MFLTLELSIPDDQIPSQILKYYIINEGLHMLLPSFGRFFGVEISSAQLAQIDRREGVTFLRGSAEEWPEDIPRVQERASTFYLTN